MKLVNLMLAALSVNASFAIAQPEEVHNGGELLRGLIERCDIVGIGSSNGGAKYALRKIRNEDIDSVKNNALIINNLSPSENQVSSRRPKQIALYLNKVERDTSGDISKYYISGLFTNEPTQGKSRVTQGFLKEIAFSPNDRMNVTFNNKYEFRGKMVSVSFDPSDLASQPFERNSAWDLALPTSFNKDAICASRETSPRDVIFIR